MGGKGITRGAGAAWRFLAVLAAGLLAVSVFAATAVAQPTARAAPGGQPTASCTLGRSAATSNNVMAMTGVPRTIIRLVA